MDALGAFRLACLDHLDDEGPVPTLDGLTERERREARRWLEGLAAVRRAVRRWGLNAETPPPREE